MAENYRKKYKKHYGIEFGREYVVHHIDENRENNNIDNLLLLPLKLHSKYHMIKAICLPRIQDGLCMDLTYYGMMQRDMQMCYLNDLLNVLSEVNEWVTYKFLADNGMAGYKDFKERQKWQ